jgi:gliding motility-associated-like protein
LWIALALAYSYSAAAQSCDCPAVNSCSVCNGGLSSLTLQFNGSVTSNVIVTDQIGAVFNNQVEPGATFSFIGSIPNDKFVGQDIVISINGVQNATISSSCNGFAIGAIYGSFTVRAARSKSGGPICCPAALMEKIAPTFQNIPTDITRVLPSNACTIAVPWTAPTPSDNCSVASLTSTHAPGDLFRPGVTTVTYTAKDIYGNVGTCSFKVTVSDTQAPAISSCPANIAAIANASCQAAVSWNAPTASDNCTLASFTSTHQPGALFPIGVTTVTYTAKDVNGNSSVCSFKVTVSDTQAPVISSCPTNITAVANASCKAVVSWNAPTASDNCTLASFTSTHQPGATFPMGITTVTYTAKDNAGNTSTCSFKVTVSDTQAPLISGCPADIVAPVNASCKAVVTWNPPTASDNCTLASFTSTHNSGASFPIGTTTVTYTAKDNAGNSSICSFKVTVSDTQAPVINQCPTEIHAIANSSCEAVVSWNAPTVSDNCSITLTSTHAPGATFSLGKTKVTYTATDVAGNKSTCSFDVVVTTEQALTVSECPGDTIIDAEDNGEVVVNWNEPQATVNCGDVKVTKSHSPGESFAAGKTVVQYEFMDDVGNVSTCSFVVEVNPPDAIVTVSQIVTPDGNGVNDRWLITNIEKYTSNTVVVLDRWGNKIYNQNGYDNVTVYWDGTNSSGKVVPTGTYFYSIEIKNGETVIKKTGFLEVIQ